MTHTKTRTHIFWYQLCILLNAGCCCQWGRQWLWNLYVKRLISHQTVRYQVHHHAIHPQWRPTIPHTQATYTLKRLVFKPVHLQVQKWISESYSSVSGEASFNPLDEQQTPRLRRFGGHGTRGARHFRIWLQHSNLAIRNQEAADASEVSRSKMRSWRCLDGFNVFYSSIEHFSRFQTIICTTHYSTYIFWILIGKTKVRENSPAMG